MHGAEDVNAKEKDDVVMTAKGEHCYRKYVSSKDTIIQKVFVN